MRSNKDIQSIGYETEVNEKALYLQQLLKSFYTSEITVFKSNPEHYRLRAEFRIWHDDDGLHYVMTPKGEKANQQTIIYTPQLPHASVSINRLMPTLIQTIAKSPLLSHQLFQVEFLSTLSDDMLVTLIYHRQLNNEWQQAAQALSDTLDIPIIGRARKQKIVLERDFVIETFTVAERQYHYRQYEGGFTQPNGEICQTMLNWTTEQATQLNVSDSDLLELYCGNGNFTLPLAACFRKVLATEISKTSVKALRENIALNHIDNIKVARLSAEEFTTAYEKKRAFRRLQQDGIELDDYEFSCIFVDPPRAGIDHHTLNAMQNFQHIIYISCNPQTLQQNLIHLIKTHDVTNVTMFDQFPGTAHIETGVILSRK